MKILLNICASASLILTVVSILCFKFSGSFGAGTPNSDATEYNLLYVGMLTFLLSAFFTLFAGLFWIGKRTEK